MDVDEAIPPSQQHVCKICSRGFLNKHSLGGHMRVHSADERRLQAKSPTQFRHHRDECERRERVSPMKSRHDYVSDSSDGSELFQPRRKNSWKKRARSAAVAVQKLVGKVLDEDAADGGEMDDEYLRWKKSLSNAEVAAAPSPAGDSGSNRCPHPTALEEDAVVALLALSPGKKLFSGTGSGKAPGRRSSKKLRSLSDVGARKVEKIKMRIPRQCNICKRTFSSYQALGGHVKMHMKKVQPKPAGGLPHLPESEQEHGTLQQQTEAAVIMSLQQQQPSENIVPSATNDEEAVASSLSWPAPIVPDLNLPPLPEGADFLSFL